MSVTVEQGADGVAVGSPSWLTLATTVLGPAVMIAGGGSEVGRTGGGGGGGGGGGAGDDGDRMEVDTSASSSGGDGVCLPEGTVPRAGGLGGGRGAGAVSTTTVGAGEAGSSDRTGSSIGRSLVSSASSACR